MQFKLLLLVMYRGNTKRYLQFHLLCAYTATHYWRPEFHRSFALLFCKEMVFLEGLLFHDYCKICMQCTRIATTFLGPAGLLESMCSPCTDADAQHPQSPIRAIWLSMGWYHLMMTQAWPTASWRSSGIAKKIKILLAIRGADTCMSCASHQSTPELFHCPSIGFSDAPRTVWTARKVDGREQLPGLLFGLRWDVHVAQMDKTWLAIPSCSHTPSLPHRRLYSQRRVRAMLRGGVVWSLSVGAVIKPHARPQACNMA